MFRTVMSTQNRAYSFGEPQPRMIVWAALGWMFRGYRSFRRTQDKVEAPGIHF